MKKWINIILWILLALILALVLIFFIRLINPREIDDVAPGIRCDNSLLQKSDILWVVPDYSSSIADNEEWCKNILSLNKSLGLHGIHHTYNEFGIIRNRTYVEKGIADFEKCFGYKPNRFKPPQLSFIDKNVELIKSENMSLSFYFEEITHKVYHCSDTGKFSNELIKWF